MISHVTSPASMDSGPSPRSWCCCCTRRGRPDSPCVRSRHLSRAAGDRCVDLLPHLGLPALPAVRPLSPLGPRPAGSPTVLDTAPPPHRSGVLAGPHRAGLWIPHRQHGTRMAGRSQPLPVSADLLSVAVRLRHPPGVVTVHRSDLLPVPPALRLGCGPPSTNTRASAQGGTVGGGHVGGGELCLPLLGAPHPPGRRTSRPPGPGLRPELWDRAAPLDPDVLVATVVSGPLRIGHVAGHHQRLVHRARLRAGLAEPSVGSLGQLGWGTGGVLARVSRRERCRHHLHRAARG